MTWPALPREQFSAVWQSLPSLTVLATLPGWGRTTWMRLAEAEVQRNDPTVPVRWVRDRRTLASALAAPIPSREPS